MKEVADGVWQLTGFPPNGINEYLLGDVLVDAGAKQGKRQILKDLRGHTVTAHALTHAHADHQGASKAVCETLDIPFWVGDRRRRRRRATRADPRAPARQADQQGLLEGRWPAPGSPSTAACPRATRWPASRSWTCRATPPATSPSGASRTACWCWATCSTTRTRSPASRRPAPAVRLLHARPGAEPPVGQAPGRAGAQAGAVRPRPAAAGHEEVRGVHPRPLVAALAHSGRARRPPQAARGAQALRARRDRGAGVDAVGGGRRVPPRARGRGGRELLDRGAAAQRHRRAAHGPRAQRFDPGRLLARRAHARAEHASGSTAPTTRASPRRSRSSSSCATRAPAARRSGREAFAERVWQWREQYGSRDHASSSGGWAPRSTWRTSASRWTSSTRARCAHVFVRPLREGPRLPRQLHGQLGPGHRLGDLGPRGRAALGRGHAVLDRLPAGVRRRLGDRGHRAPGDHAGRHRDRGEPRRRALHAPGRRGGDPADRRAPAADHRRPPRGPRVRHRRAEDHAGPRPQRLRDRPQARPRRDQRDRRGRPHVGRGRRALRGPVGRGRAPRGGGRPARGRPASRAPGPTSTTCPTPTARARASSR